jgi:MFS family permease
MLVGKRAGAFRFFFCFWSDGSRARKPRRQRNTTEAEVQTQQAKPSEATTWGGVSRRQARLAVVLLLAINLFNYIDRQVLTAVVPDIGEAFFPGTYDRRTHEWKDRTVEAQLGSLGTAFIVSYLLAAPLFGWLGDRWSRWLLIGVGVLLWSLASGASGLAPSFALLWLTRCCVGVGEGAYGPTAPTLLSDLYPVERRGTILAWFYAAIPVGSALGYALGGLAAGRLGDWRWGFYVVVPPGLLLGACCFFLREPVRGSADAAPPRLASWKDYRSLLYTPSYILDTLGMAAMTFALGGLGYWIPHYVREYRNGGSADEVGLIFGLIVAVAGLGGTLLGGWLADRLRPRLPGAYFLVSGAAMLLGFPFILLVICLPFPLAWIPVFLACFCLFINTGPTNAILANVTHPAVRSSGFALNIFVIHILGDAISPPVIGLISGYTNMDLAFVLVSALVLVGGLLWFWGARYLERDTALAPHRLEGPAGVG